jgi:excisionase family DNA binding protein
MSPGVLLRPWGPSGNEIHELRRGSKSIGKNRHVHPLLSVSLKTAYSMPVAAKDKYSVSPIHPLMTVSDLANYLDISRGAIYDMLKAGDIPHLRIFNKDVRFRRDIIDHWIAKRSPKPPKDNRSSPPASPFMTTEELADHLRISKSKVYKMVRTGEIPYIRVFDKLGDYRFDRDTIAEWIRNKRGSAFDRASTPPVNQKKTQT